MGDKNLSLKQITHSKLFLLIGAVCAAAVDLLIIIMLGVGGGRDTHYVYPALMLALDIGYLVLGVFFTDYRFKYSLLVWISYVILYGALTAAGLGTILGGSGTVITAAAIWLWALVHITLIVCAVVAALCASRFVKNFWVACVFGALGICFLAGYAAFVGINGFYGQGLNGRPLVYAYDSANDAYTASDVLGGRSNKVVVPETFNGKPVTAVSYNVLLKSGVKEYSLPADVTFCDGYRLNSAANLNGKVIKVDKSGVNAVREMFYGAAESANGLKNGIALANATLPDGLAEDEGYVAFNYSEEAFKACGGEVIPVYVGALDEFDADTYAASFDYVARRDAESIANLDAAYNEGGYILSDIAGEKGSVFGGVSSNTVGWVNFDKIYRVYVLAGNDEKYDMRTKQPGFCSDELNGSSLGYRYVTGGKASAFLSGATPRKGFNLQWVAMSDGGSTDISNLASTLESLKESEVTLVPVWSLKAPVVTVSSDKGNKLTYGDSVALSSNVLLEADGVDISYQWSYGANSPEEWNESGLSFLRPLPAYSGSYTLTVTAGGGEITSLTAEATAQINLEIAKKKISFGYEAPDDLVFDGTAKTVNVTFDTSQLVAGDLIAYTVNGGTNEFRTETNAGTYAINVEVAGGNIDEKYEYLNTSYSFTIQKKPVVVEWSGYENLVYNGSSQVPSAEAYGIAGEGNIVSSVTGEKTDAGTYTATAVCGDSNYRFLTSIKNFTIEKATLTVTPSAVRHTYGSLPDTSQISLNYSGFVGGETGTPAGLSGSANYAFKSTKAGEYEDGVTVNVAGLTSRNYKFVSGGAGKLTIDKLTVEVGQIMSGFDSLIYDGKEHGLLGLWVQNRVEDDDVEIEAENLKAVNAGTYKAKAVALTGADAGNYVLPEDAGIEYTIGKRTATVVWHDLPQNPVYIEEGYSFSYTIDNLAEGDEKYFSFGSFGISEAGDYVIQVEYANHDDSDKYDKNREFIKQNYNLIDETVYLTIPKVESKLHIFVNGVEISGSEYNGYVFDKVTWTADTSVTVTVNKETNIADSFTAQSTGVYNFVFNVASDRNHNGGTVTLKFIASARGGK